MQTAADQKDQPTQKGQSIRLLVVDDDEGILWSLKELLGIYDFEIETAQSGLEALDVLHRTKPDGVLIDIVMPKQSGVDVFREIKPLRPRLPFIFMTGYAESKLADEARREGAMDVIAKPIDMEQLVGLLEHITPN